MRRFVATAIGIGLIAASAASAATPPRVSVTPSSGSLGTTFTISFLTPSAAGKRAYHVHGHVANASSRTNGCVTTLDFFNPRKVMANQHVKFTFTLTASEGLCTGRWTVTVKLSGSQIGKNAHFTIQ